MWNGNIRVLYSLDTFNRRKSSQKKEKKKPRREISPKQKSKCFKFVKGKEKL